MLKINEIYLMDCLDFLKKIDDGSVNLAILDPPYNFKKAKWDTFKSQKDFLKFTFGWIDILIPKLKQNSSLYIFNTPYNCAFILPHVLEKGLRFQNWITWDKRDGFASANKKYVARQETILFFTKGNNYIFNVNDIRLPYESTERIKHAKEKGIIKNDKRWFPNPKGRLRGDVWHISSERHKNKINGKTPKLPHLTPKPIDMIETIVKASSNPGDLVLDCFVGSGATALAAKRLSRNYICSDNNKNYFRLAKNNLKKYASK